MSGARFRHEDVSAVPAGWKVRTVTHGKHRVRVAFPPGRRQKGSGRLVSVLHPIGENPCTLRSANPAELLVLGGDNPPRGNRGLPKARVETYQMVSRITGKPIRKATRVIFADGKKVEFMERLPKRMAIRAAMDQLGRNPSELLVLGANPRVEVVHGDNPPVEEIAERFSGVSADWIDVYNEPHMARGKYAQLGGLLALYIKPAKGGQVQKISFAENDLPIVVTDHTAKQLYFVSGGQDISSALDSFGGRDRGNGVVELGQARRIDYECRKEHVADPDEDKWKHNHGEEDGQLPTVLFDTRTKRLLYEGGNYRVEGPWIHN